MKFGEYLKKTKDKVHDEIHQVAVTHANEVIDEVAPEITDRADAYIDEKKDKAILTLGLVGLIGGSFAIGYLVGKSNGAKRATTESISIVLNL